LPAGSDAEYCSDCKKREHIFTRGFSVFQYRSVSGSVYRFKYLGRQEYAMFYALATRKSLGKKLKSLGIEAIVPVPMYGKKQRKRGYNQAEVYAGAVSRVLDIPMDSGIIRRVKDTVPMKELDALRRRNNLKKAFIIPQNEVKYKCVLIIDDIYTTGSTIDEIAHEFQMAGVDRIYFLTLAIGQTT
jgi:ComF family protein